MKSTIGVILRASFAHGDCVHMLRHELFEVYAVVHTTPTKFVSALCEPSIVIEQLGRTWTVLLLDFTSYELRWDEVREVILDYATQCAFMHPAVFEDFIQAMNLLNLKDSDLFYDAATLLPSNDGYKHISIRLKNEDGSNIVKRR